MECTYITNEYGDVEEVCAERYGIPEFSIECEDVCYDTYDDFGILQKVCERYCHSPY